MAVIAVDASAPAVAPGKQRRRNKPQQSNHDVAGIVHVALAAKQRGEERALATQTRRRKRAIRKHKRTEQHTVTSTIDTGTQAPSSPVHSRPVHADGDEAAVVVVVENLVAPEELDDSDEFDDVVADLKADFQFYGRLLSFETIRDTGVITLTYADLEGARAAVREKHGKRFGGREVVARLAVAKEQQDAPMIATDVAQDTVIKPQKEVYEQLGPVDAGDMHMEKKKKKRLSKVKNAVLRQREESRLHAATCATSSGAGAETSCCKFCVCNLLTSDEVEDEDELSELQDDTRAEFAAFGTLTHLEIVSRNVINRVDDHVEPSSCTLVLQNPGDVVVGFKDPDCAAAAFRAYDENIFGGRVVKCQWLMSTSPHSSPATEVSDTASHTIKVTNMLSPDELLDPDEVEDLQDEVTEMFECHGAILSLEICRTSGAVTVEYESLEAAQRAVAEVNQSVYGGRCVRAIIVANDRAVDDERDHNGLQVDASKAERPFAVVVRSSSLQVCLIVVCLLTICFY